MRKKSFLLIIAAICFALLFAGCQPPPALTSAQYDAMIARSLVSSGNNFRLKAAIAKARGGSDVNIAYIGGSITEGAGASVNGNCYASMSAASFRTLFTHGTLINAGMSGTPSTLGMIRYKRDVVDRLGGQNPDIVFIEFAVNDYGEPTNGAAYESMVRDILSAPNSPAVVLVFAVFPTMWNIQDTYIPVGSAYGLPMISIKDAISPEIASGALTTGRFFADQYHPNDYGHQVMSDCTTHLFQTVDGEAAALTDIVFPGSPVKGLQYQGIKMIDSITSQGASITKGSFSGTDSTLGTFLYAPTRFTFPDNWYQTGGTTTPFSMTLNCSNLLIVYKQSSSSSFGTAQVTVDGPVVKNLNAYSSSGWNNPMTDIVPISASGSHTVTVSCPSNFSILAFGYTE